MVCILITRWEKFFKFSQYLYDIGTIEFILNYVSFYTSYERAMRVYDSLRNLKWVSSEFD